MPPDGVQAGIAGNHFPNAAGSRVALKDALDVGTQAGKHETKPFRGNPKV
jgi:hypothetical protein